jgi:hypothetical protein
MVVCKEPFRFFVDAATFEVGQCTEQKVRHSAIRSNLLAHFNLNVAVYYRRRWEAKDEVVGELAIRNVMVKSRDRSRLTRLTGQCKYRGVVPSSDGCYS